MTKPLVENKKSHRKSGIKSKRMTNDITILVTKEAQQHIREKFDANLQADFVQIAKTEHAPVNIICLNGNQTVNGIKRIMKENYLSSEEVILMAANTAEGKMVNNAKRKSMEVVSVTRLPNMINSWGPSVI